MLIEFQSIWEAIGVFFLALAYIIGWIKKFEPFSNRANSLSEIFRKATNDLNSILLTWKKNGGPPKPNAYDEQFKQLYQTLNSIRDEIVTKFEAVQNQVNSLTEYHQRNGHDIKEVK